MNISGKERVGLGTWTKVSAIMLVFIMVAMVASPMVATARDVVADDDSLITVDNSIAGTTAAENPPEPQIAGPLIPLTQTRYGWRGEYVDHVITIWNFGPTTDVFLPMFGTFDNWRVKFWNLDRNGNKNEKTWWIGPIPSGGSMNFIAEVRIPGVDAGDFMQTPITVTSRNTDAVIGTVNIITRTSLTIPYFNDFNSGVFGQGVTPKSDWTTDNPAQAGVNAATSYNGDSMFHRWGPGEITSAPFYTEGPPSIITSYWVQRGSDAFSENPDAGEDLIVEYTDQGGQWHELDRFPGGGTPGEIFMPVHQLPPDAQHPAFQLRFRQTGGSSADGDYWHIDDVYIGPQNPNFDLLPDTYAPQDGGPGDIVQYNFQILNNAPYPDYYNVYPVDDDWTTNVLLFSDDFNDGDYNGWTVVDEGWNNAPSFWQVTNGELVQFNNIWGPNGQAWPGTYVLNGDAAWTDYTISARLYSGDNDGIGLMGRYTDANNYYRFQWSLDGGWDRDTQNPGLQRRVLDKQVNGVWTVLASDNVPYSPWQLYDVEMKFIGDNIQVYTDGQLVFDVIDGSLNSGQIALYSWGNTGSYFDDVVVSMPLDTLGPVFPGQTADFIATVEIPAGAGLGAIDNAFIEAASVYDPTITDTTPIETYVYPVHNIDQDTYHPTIQDGVDLASPSDNILVYPGTYPENIVIDKPLTLTGVDKSTTIINGGGSGVYFVTGTIADYGWGNGEDSRFFIENTFDWLWPTEANSGNILLIWGGWAWNDAWRNEMASRTIPYTQTDGASVTAADLDPALYDMIIISEYMPTAHLPNMESLVPELENYVNNGGVLIDMIGTNNVRRWSTGTPGPFGTVTQSVNDGWNYVANPGHPMVANMNLPAFSGSSASHARITTPPAGSDILLTSGNTPGGQPIAAWLRGTGDNLIKIQSNDVTVEGFTITGGLNGVKLVNSGNTVIQDNDIANNNDNGIVVTGNAYADSFFDDFSTDTGSWNYYGSATRTNGYLQLTSNVGGQVGQIWYNQPINTDFTVDFDYRIGELGGGGADGMVFMFYHDTAYVPGNGGSLGFGTPVPGYGVEFDHWNNGGNDPSAEHVALIKDSPYDPHLASVDMNIDDGVWRNVRVTVESSTISVFHVDMTTPIFTWTGAVDTTFGGFGFSAATGGATATQRIDNVVMNYGTNLGNTITNNNIQNNAVGVSLNGANGNSIYHNNFIGNTVQALDDRSNTWDNGYPSGGNYWDDYAGSDSFSGPLQNVAGSDGIGDTPYVIDGDSQDNYPLMGQYTTGLWTPPLIVEYPIAEEEEVSEEPSEPAAGSSGGGGAVNEISEPATAEPEVPAADEPEAIPETVETDEQIIEPVIEEELAPVETVDEVEVVEADEIVDNIGITTTETPASEIKGNRNTWQFVLFPLFIVVLIPSAYYRKKRK